MVKQVPVVGLVGYSGSGKTTFLEKLVTELVARGYRLAVVKHTHHRIELDRPGKDTWRLARAGAGTVVLASPGALYLVRKWEGDPGPLEAVEAAAAGGADLVLVEGYKRGPWPKIEVFCGEVSERPDLPAEELLAVVGKPPQAKAGLPVFDPEDAAGVADLLERTVLGGGQKREVRNVE